MFDIYSLSNDKTLIEELCRDSTLCYYITDIYVGGPPVKKKLLYWIKAATCGYEIILVGLLFPTCDELLRDY